MTIRQQLNTTLDSSVEVIKREAFCFVGQSKAARKEQQEHVVILGEGVAPLGPVSSSLPNSGPGSIVGGR